MVLRDLLERFDLPREVREALERASADRETAAQRAAMLQAILDGMSEGVAVTDASGCLVLFNRTAEALMGLGSSGEGPETWTETYGVFLPDGVTPCPVERYPLVRALSGEESDDVELFVRNPSCPEGRYIRVSGRPWRDEAGAILGAVATFRDVTQLKQAWAALERAKTDLERRVEERTRELAETREQFHRAQRLESLGRLSGGIAHDFNNLLTALSGYTEELLSGERLSPADHEAVVEIRRLGDRAAALTSQLLDFSRKRPVELRPVEVNAVIFGLERLLQRLLGDKIRIELDLDAEIPSVRSDPAQLEQVVLNLAINARDAMPDGGRLMLRTSWAHRGATPAGGYVRIEVIDSGSGMDAATVERIFEPFFTTKAEGGGTGLGLSTVYGIVKQGGGDVRVESAPGRGTRFEVLLPISGEPRPRTAQSPALAPRAKPGETILLAEDEEEVRRLVRQILEACGYRVLVADDGDRAERLAETYSGPIDLLLTDSVMPRQSGFTLAARLRECRAGLRVLYMSGFPERALAVAGQLGDGTAFLAKPFTPLELGRKVREVLDGPADAG